MTRRFTGDKIVLATYNPHKVAELRDILAARVPQVFGMADLGLPEPAETGTTFLENATIKALAAAKAAKMPALADDSGLCIAALGGAPGVYTADLMGHPRNPAKGRAEILQALRDQDDRRAYFQTVLVLAWPDGHIEVTEGRINGTITRTPRGRMGFMMDPLFMPAGYAKTFGEMLPPQKESMSHRIRALNAMFRACF